MKSAPVLLTLSDSKHVVLPVDDDSDLNVVAAFDRRGEYIYTGNAKGKVSLPSFCFGTVLSCVSLKVLFFFFTCLNRLFFSKTFISTDCMTSLMRFCVVTVVELFVPNFFKNIF